MEEINDCRRAAVAVLIINLTVLWFWDAIFNLGGFYTQSRDATYMLKYKYGPGDVCFVNMSFLIVCVLFLWKLYTHSMQTLFNKPLQTFPNKTEH